MSYFAPNLHPDKHCFFDRFGGASTGKYAELNFNPLSLEADEIIEHNLEYAASRFCLHTANFATLQQGVSGIAHYVDTPSRRILTGDALVTDKPGIILGVRTSDCAPVILADYKHKVIGIAHAGWRGALNGVLESTLNLMLERGAVLDNIAAATGPCLQTTSFLTRKDMREEYIKNDASYTRFFIPTSDSEQFLFALEDFVRSRLENLGLKNITFSGIDTYTNPAYYSYRRSTHQKLISRPKDFPVHLSTITL